jgi:hypothetical protein
MYIDPVRPTGQAAHLAVVTEIADQLVIRSKDGETGVKFRHNKPPFVGSKGAGANQPTLANDAEERPVKAVDLDPTVATVGHPHLGLGVPAVDENGMGTIETASALLAAQGLEIDAVGAITVDEVLAITVCDPDVPVPAVAGLDDGYRGRGVSPALVGGVRRPGQALDFGAVQPELDNLALGDRVVRHICAVGSPAHFLAGVGYPDQLLAVFVYQCDAVALL